MLSLRRKPMRHADYRRMLVSRRRMMLSPLDELASIIMTLELPRRQLSRARGRASPDACSSRQSLISPSFCFEFNWPVAAAGVFIIFPVLPPHFCFISL